MLRFTSVCLVTACLVLASGCRSSKEDFVAKGNKLVETGKYEEAIINYRKAIQKDSNYGEAHYRLGLAAIKLNEGQEAYDALMRATQLLPANVDAKEKLANVCLSFYLRNGNRIPALYNQLIQLSDELLAKNANSYQGLVVKGYIALTDQKSNEAISYFRRAMAMNSSDPGVVTQVVMLLLKDGQVTEAETLASDLIVRQKISYAPIYDTMYTYYAEAGRSADAENILKSKFSNNPKVADYALQLARFYYRAQKPEQMKATLQRLLDNPKDFAQARLWVGDFYLGVRDYAEAIRYYQEGVGANSDGAQRVLFQKRTILALLAAGKKDEARRLSETILAENPKDDEALRLRADMLMDGGASADLANALRTLRDLSARHPNDPALRFRLGRAYQATGDLESARTQFLEAIKQKKDLLSARYELAELDLSLNRPAEALQQCNDILQVRPNDRKARLLRARSWTATNDLLQARAELTALNKEAPGDPEAEFWLGIVAIRQEKYREAVEIFERQLRGKGNPRSAAALGVAYASQRQFDKALDVLRQGLKNWPDSPVILERLASTEALAGHYDAAITQYQRMAASQPKSPSLRMQMGSVYQMKGDYRNAATFFRQAYDLTPSDITVGLSLAAALSQGGNAGEARSVYQKILKEHPDNASALNNLAFLLADTGGDLQEALRLAKQALDKAPAEPGYSDTIGYIYLKQGLHDNAVRTFANLAKKYPKVAPFRYHLGLALYEKGDKAAAMKELQAALASHPSREDESRIKELMNKIG